MGLGFNPNASLCAMMAASSGVMPPRTWGAPVLGPAVAAAAAASPAAMAAAVA